MCIRAAALRGLLNVNFKEKQTMFKRTRITVVLGMIVAMLAMVLSGCMPMGTSTTAEGGAEGAAGGLSNAIIPFILIIVLFYFILIRPQNKKNKQVNEMRSALKRGDWVTTIGGFRGRVTKIKDELVSIEVGPDKVKMEIMRWGISKIDDSAPVRKSSKADADDDKDEAEEETAKRKPKKLTPVPKKEEEPEDEPDDEDFDDDDDDEDEDEDEK